jgi:hypothetical protein
MACKAVTSPNFFVTWDSTTRDMGYARLLNLAH